MLSPRKTKTHCRICSQIRLILYVPSPAKSCKFIPLVRCNPLPNEQNAAANADARARKREFCECGSGFDARMSIQPHRWKSFRTASLKSAFLPNPSRKKLLPIYNCTSTQKTKYVLDLKALTILRQMMSMASPKLKNLYRSLTASSYALSTFSRPASADTSIIKVDSGRWKFVISASSTLKRYPG